MPTLFQIRSFITYWLDAVEEHSLHSPFLFDFYKHVVKGKVHSAIPLFAENYRNRLLDDLTTISLTDYGAGSVSQTGQVRSISSIARMSASPKKYSQLYTSIISYFKHTHILELGTSLGINTLYLANQPGTKVISFEGDKSLLEIAQNAAHEIGATNIQYIEGNIDQTLNRYLMHSPLIDFALLDANHRYTPTIKYAEQLIKRTHPRSVLILDDIHLTPEMEQAWNQLIKHKLVYTSVDLYRCGILFFDPSLNKQHVVMQF